MAVNETRSMRNDLALGVTDGVVKNVTPDRGGVTSSRDAAAMRHLLMGEYDADSYGHGPAAAKRILSL